MASITSSPVQVGDSYSTKYNGQATTTAEDFIFPSVQDSIIVTNYGFSYITAVSSGESVRIPPNGGIYRFKSDSDTVNIKSSGVTNPITIEGRSLTSGAGSGVDIVARADIQSFNEKLTERAKLTVSIKTYYENGDTDWTQAFLRAISFIESIGGGKIEIPSGSYLVQPDIIKLCSNISIVGVGLPRVYTSYGTYYSYIIGQDNTILRTNIEITGILFDQYDEIGKGIDEELASMKAIQLYKAQNVRIHHNQFNAVGRNNVSVNGSACKNVKFHDNYIYFKRLGTVTYDASAVYMHTEKHEVYNNVIIADNFNSPSSFRMGCGIESHGQNTKVYNNYIVGVTNAINVTTHTYASNYKKMGQDVFNNKFEACLNGIRLWSYEIDGGMENVSIHDNKIFLKSFNDAIGGFGVGVTPNSLDGTISLKGDITNLKIYNNTVSHEGNVSEYTATNDLSVYDAAAINLWGAGNLKKVYVRNNYIERSPVLTFCIGSQNATALHQEVYFENNKIDDCSYYTTLNKDIPCLLAYVHKSNNVFIKNNDIILRTRTRTSRYWRFVYIDSTSITNFSTGKLVITGNNKISYGSFDTVSTKLSTTDYSTYDILLDYDLWVSKLGNRISYIYDGNDPTTGTFLVNDYLIYIGQTAISGYRGKTCTASGTANTITANAVNSPDDTNTLIISNLVGTIKVGDYLKVNGAGTQRVVGINGSSITFSSSVTTGATAISNRPPVFANLV